ncbi:MAG: cytochrome c [Chloroflexi bacterium]|nr:MAG: cytochrome c [Chloroflexota bacterium]MBL1193572.1 cytochrome c [Chloroflexota bacterium]NOH10863.1 cytochrome c [Chloroflexota bacterium]
MSKSYKSLFVFILILIAALASACADQRPAPAPEAAIDPRIEQGKTIYTQNCASCHATSPETVIVGPSLHNIATISETRVDGQDAKTYLELSIMEPGDHVVEGYNDIMPSTFGKSLSGEDFDALIAYLLSLK